MRHAPRERVTLRFVSASHGPAEVVVLARWKKGRDGPDVLTCTRADGTGEWRRLEAGLAFHDLAHAALEPELGLARGFFGLVAAGWSFARFADAEERAELPDEAFWVELAVNQLLVELACGEVEPAAAFHATLARSADALDARRRARGGSAASVAAVASAMRSGEKLDDVRLDRVRARLREHAARWRALPPGETLELSIALLPAARAPHAE